MNKTDYTKKKFLSIYSQLNYDYQNIILNTFKHLARYDEIPKKGYKAYDISGVIKYYQKKRKYSDQQVCDMVNKIIASESEKILDIGTYRKIKRRNTQSSKSNTNWLNLISQVLEFDSEEYHKYLTQESITRISKHSNEINSISTLYDLLSEMEKKALIHLTTSLLRLCIASENTTEDDGYEIVDN